MTIHPCYGKLVNNRMHLAVRIVLALTALVALNAVVAVLVMHMESLNYTDAFYLTMSAATLSGYGNVAPETVGGKWFVSFYQLVGYTVFFYLVTVACAAVPIK